MKAPYFVTASLLVIMATCSLADDTDEHKKEQAKEMFRGMAQDCKKKVGASDDDLEALIDDKAPDTKVQKCLLGCLQKQFGVIDGSKFSRDGFLEACRMMYGKDQEKMKLWEEIADECSEVTNEDECQLAMDIKECIDTGMQKRGIEE